MTKTFIAVVLAAATLGAAAAPASAQPYWRHHWRHWHHWHHWHDGYGYGPHWGYWRHRHGCRWHPYRCGW